MAPIRGQYRRRRLVLRGGGGQPNAAGIRSESGGHDSPVGATGLRTVRQRHFQPLQFGESLRLPGSERLSAVCRQQNFNFNQWQANYDNAYQQNYDNLYFNWSREQLEKTLADTGAERDWQSKENQLDRELQKISCFTELREEAAYGTA